MLQKKNLKQGFIKSLKFPPILFTLMILIVFAFVNVIGYIQPSLTQPATQLGQQIQPARVIYLVALEDFEKGTYGFNMSKGGPIIEIKKGELVRIVIVNKGTLVHDISIEGLNVTTGLVPPGETVYMDFTANSAGEFQYFCSITGHRELGMEGILIVREEGG
jgi:nitrite reductase (NO-forming)